MELPKNTLAVHYSSALCWFRAIDSLFYSQIGVYCDFHFAIFVFCSFYFYRNHFTLLFVKQVHESLY